MPRIAGLAACLPACDELLDQRAEVDALERRAGELGVGPRRFADVADQAVEPADVLAGDVDQPLAQARDPRPGRGRRRAERSEASGFLSSWVTSAAKASILSIRCRSDWLMSDTARASRPISSLREGRRGTLTSRARPSRTRCAASASRRSGRTMVRARKSDSRTESSDRRTAIAATNDRRAGSRTVRVKVAVVVGDQQHAAADRDRGRDDRGQVGRIADLSRRPDCRLLGASTASGQACSRSTARLDEIVERLGADQGIEAAVERARDVLGPVLRARDRAARRSGRSAASCRPAACRRGRRGACGSPVDLRDGGEQRRPLVLRDVAPERLPRSSRFDPRLAACAPCSAGCGRRRGRAC